MDNIINNIIQKKLICYFISPHLDDAIYSAGALIDYLKDKTTVRVINVFCNIPEQPFTKSAQSYIRQCGYADHKQLSQHRLDEDKAVWEKLSVPVNNLGLTDALYRKKETTSKLFHFINIPELIHIYPTYRFHISKGKVSPDDNETIKVLTKKLQSIPKDIIVFCPVGIGNHVDHVLVRDVCSSLFENIIYWSDYPYNLSSHNSYNDFVRSMREFSFPVNLSRKEQLLQAYKTQYKAVFKNNLHIVDERFYK